MKKNWYKSGIDLLEEIKRSSPQQGSVHIWYMGQHGFVISMENTIFYIDVILNGFIDNEGIDRRNYTPPFLPDEIQRVDYYIATHNHSDHLNLDTLKPLAKANPKTRFIVPRPWVSILKDAGIEESRIIGACADESFEADSVKIHPVPAIHTRYIQDEALKDSNGDCNDLGFVIKAAGLSLYHPGDTWITSGLVDTLKGLGPLHIAMLPINGTDWERTADGCIGNISVMDAVKLAMAVPIDLVIPCHYDMFANNSENPAFFADSMYRYCSDKRFHICDLGERFIYSIL